MNKIIFCLLIAYTLSQTIPNPFSSTGRYYWVGGAFSNVTSINATSNVRTTIPAGNIAQWDGLSWTGTSAMGTGTDGPVINIQADVCNNIYVVGKFANVNGVATGPVTRWRPNAKVWEALGTAGQVKWNSGSYINAVTIDCANFPTTNNCPCDIYLGGSFSAVIAATNKVAQNVIKYSYSTSSWDDLGSQGVVNGEVFALYKKGFGITQATDYLYVGGNQTISAKGGFTKYNTNTKAWGYDFPSSAGNVVGTVLSFQYMAYTFSTDQLYVGGDFTWTTSSATVKNLAQFTWNTEVIQAVGSTGVPNLPVYSLGYGASDLYLSTSESTPSLSYVRKNAAFSSTTSSWTTISGSDSTYILQPILDIFVCDSQGIIDCQGGSVAMVGTNGFLKYYNAKTNQFLDFGGGTNGNLRTIESAYLLSGTSTIQVSLFCFFGFILVFLF